MTLFKMVASLRVKRPKKPTRISGTMKGLYQGFKLGAFQIIAAAAVAQNSVHLE